MAHSIIIDMEEFETTILWPRIKGPIPEPSTRALDVANASLRPLFYADDTQEQRLYPSEYAIAHPVVHDIINRIDLPQNHKASLSQHNDDPFNASPSRVDATLYPHDELPPDDRPNWTHYRAFILFKKGGRRHDPWADEFRDPSESWAQSRAQVRGELLQYAHSAFLRQHRTHLYALFINGTEFRALRWERSGLVVTESADYLQDPSTLLRFLWAFASLNDAEQGIDPSATLVSSDMPEWERMDSCAQENNALDMPYLDRDDVSRFLPSTSSASTGSPAHARRQDERSSPPVFKFVRDSFRESLAPGWPRYKLRVGETKREFLVGKPVSVESTSVFGRGTRCYVALDCATGNFVFLKDYWRPFYKGAEPEGDYLKALASHDTVRPVVPTVVEHGDVLDHTTFSTNSSGFQHLIHYRIVVEEVCLKLDALQYGLQLVKIIEDCIATHRDAYEHFGLLHRDISAANIQILPRVVNVDGKKGVMWHGLLTNWALAKYLIDDDPRHERQPERTGTWQFTPVAHVRHPDRPVTIADELESFFHVLLYATVRYLRHSLEAWVTSFITDYFDALQQDGTGRRLCHPHKVNAVETSQIKLDAEVLVFRNVKGISPLNGLCDEWLALFKARYAVMDLERQTDTVAPSAQKSEPNPDEEPEELLVGYNDDGTLNVLLSSGPPTTETAPVSPEETRGSLNTLKQTTAKLDSHKATLDLFRRYRQGIPGAATKWSTRDKKGDQLGPSYDPRHQGVTPRRSAVSAVATNQRASSSKKINLDYDAHFESKSTVHPAPSGSQDPEAAAAPPRQNTRRQVNGSSSMVLLRGRDLPKRMTRAHR